VAEARYCEEAYGEEEIPEVQRAVALSTCAAEGGAPQPAGHLHTRRRLLPAPFRLHEQGMKVFRCFYSSNYCHKF